MTSHSASVNGKERSSAALSEAAPKTVTVQGRLAVATTHKDMDEAARVFEKLEYVRAQLGSESASMIEKLLIDRIALCLGRLWFVEDQVSAACSQGGVEAFVREFWDRQLTTAQNRFLKACAFLERIRQLQAGPRLAVYDAVGSIVDNEPRQITGG